MTRVANVWIHSSQFPEAVRRDLLESLRSREVNHKFHYDSVKQTHRWLALHQAYSPSRTDPDCEASYDRGFEVAAARLGSTRVHVLGLGCGGGQKDTRLLRRLLDAGKEVSYTPSDVSTAMALTARETALAVIPEERCSPLVCDLATAADLPALLNAREVAGPREMPSARLITFFGMLPNFDPQVVLPRLAELLRPADTLLVSANLAPGPDYAAGVRRILPLYDNDLTRDWLLTFLTDLGVELRDGDLRFVIEPEPTGSGLQRVAAYFHFSRERALQVGEERFAFAVGEKIRLFFSYRHTPKLVRDLLGSHGLAVLEEWITKSEEEGVFLVGRTANTR